MVATGVFTRKSRRRKICRTSVIWLVGLLLLCCQLRAFHQSNGATTDGELPSLKANNVFGEQTIASEDSVRRAAIAMYPYWNMSLGVVATNQKSDRNTTFAWKTTVMAPLQFQTKRQPIAAAALPAPVPPPIKVSLPIFVASLFKSGTTTVHSYFTCGGQRSVHWKGPNQQHTGKCIRGNVAASRTPFHKCGEYDVWTDNSWLAPPHFCYDPSIYGLQAIYEAHPTATILLTVRDMGAWLKSIARWGKLLGRLQQCRDLWPEQAAHNASNLTLDDLALFFQWHTQHVRNFAAMHPTMTYLEVRLESNETGRILEERIGIPASCWGHHNRGEMPLLASKETSRTLPLKNH
jgi:hypothetical protein